MNRLARRQTLWIATLVTLACSLPAAHAQSHPTVPKDAATLVVEGVVRQVFRSPRQMQTDYLVQIQVQRSAARAIPAGVGRLAFPAPGESVYVHVFQRQGALGRPVLEESYRNVPEERAQLRAFLAPREQGGWEGTFPDWFELLSDQPATTTPGDPVPSAPQGEVAAGDDSELGLTTTPVQLKGRLGLRVTSVARAGPAHDAGLEIGDVIVAVDGTPLTRPEQLAQVARTKATFPLVVVDVNTGRSAQVEVHVGQPAERPSTTDTVPPETPADPATRPGARPEASRSLGLSAEPVTLGQRTALKVVHLDPNGPAAKAGLEPGDVLVKINGAAVTGPEQLAAAIRKSGPTMTVTVRDNRSGRDVPVEIKLGGATPQTPEPAELDNPADAPSPGKLGVVTELAFYDVEAAVKITEVEPASPAARAGLKPGMLILEANGNAVLHPSDLVDAERNSRGMLKLTTVEPGTGKKNVINVNLDSSRTAP